MKNLLNNLGAVMCINVLFQIFQAVEEAASTDVISCRGLAALKDPCKKTEISTAIQKSKDDYLKTGVWFDPVIDCCTKQQEM